mmetsp:Transcript_50907/g.111515  ORF Transcript_50907/g.111515 Transcript_50907/m.111515 type:complete len:405 (+) Transcript_50907:91-1305(+)
MRLTPQTWQRALAVVRDSVLKTEEEGSRIFQNIPAAGVTMLIDAERATATASHWPTPAYITFVAVVAVLLIVAISMAHFHHHTRNWLAPEYQTHICRLILVAPVWAFCGLGVVLQPALFEFWYLVKETYEAFAIYSFFTLMENFLGGERRAVMNLERPGAERVKWLFPVSMFTQKGMQLDEGTLNLLRVGTWQYILVRPCMAILQLIGLRYPQSYHDGAMFQVNDLYFYYFWVTNASLSLALYCLLMFYLGGRTLLDPYRPWPKFVFVKLIVLIPWLQLLFFDGLARGGLLKVPGYQTYHQGALVLQELVAMVEMVVMAAVATNVFPVDELWVIHQRDFPEDTKPYWSIFFPKDMMHQMERFFTGSNDSSAVSLWTSHGPSPASRDDAADIPRSRSFDFPATND